MKNTIKWFGIIALIAVIGFSMIGCEMDNDAEMLDGVWDRGDIVVTFSGSTAVFTEIKSTSPWASTSVKVGDQKFKNVKKTDDLKWTALQLTYDTSTFAIKDWSDCTITMAADRKTFEVYDADTVTTNRVYTKK